MLQEKVVRAYLSRIEKDMAEITAVRLKPGQKEQLARIAEADGRTLSALVRKIVSDWLKARKGSK